MIFDSKYFGSQALGDTDIAYIGSRFSELKAAVLANAYYLSWGAAHESPLPVYEVTLARLVCGLFRGVGRWHFDGAAARSVASRADLRWGRDRRGFRRLLHPNGVCLFGKWLIDSSSTCGPYTGYFRPGSEALIVARYSTCCTETRRGHYRSLSMVGKLFPTDNPHHTEPLKTANFITQQDIGGESSEYINDAELRNAPDTTPWRRGFTGVPILLLTGLVLRLNDSEPTHRQLYEIAELGKPQEELTKAPEFMRLRVLPDHQRIDGPGLDYRDEILGHIYDAGNPVPKRSLGFGIEVSDEGESRGLVFKKRRICNWQQIGKIIFNEAVASYNGDFVLHFHHPKWRKNRNDSSS